MQWAAKTPTMMTFPLTANALNHLLAQNSWALLRLANFSGKTVRINIAPFSFACTILEDGMLCNADAQTSADAACVIAPALLPRLALQDEQAHAEIRSEGDAALLAELFYLARNLRWDAAEDLSRITGDIAAERIVQAVQAGEQQLRGTVLNLAQTAKKYRTAEQTLLIKPPQMAEFTRQVNTLRNDIMQLEQRIRHLLATNKN